MKKIKKLSILKMGKKETQEILGGNCTKCSTTGNCSSCPIFTGSRAFNVGDVYNNTHGIYGN